MRLHRSARQWSLFTHNSRTPETHNAHMNPTHSVNANVFSKVRLHATESKVFVFINSEIVPKIQHSNVCYSCSLPYFEFSSPPFILRIQICRSSDHAPQYDYIGFYVFKVSMEYSEYSVRLHHNIPRCSLQVHIYIMNRL
jgi:hypothetical protein